jgi:hypothetical protein
MQSWWTLIFSFSVAGSRGIFSFFPLFPMCSHQVFQRVPRDVPNGSSVLWIWFAQNSTPMYINWNLGEHICFYFATAVQRLASIGGMPDVPKIIVDGPIKRSWQSLSRCITLTREWCALRKHLRAMPVKLGSSLEVSLHLQFRPIDWHRCGCTLAGAWACEELGSCGLYPNALSPPSCSYLWFRWELKTCGL